MGMPKTLWQRHKQGTIVYRFSRCHVPRQRLSFLFLSLAGSQHFTDKAMLFQGPKNSFWHWQDLENMTVWKATVVVFSIGLIIHGLKARKYCFNVWSIRSHAFSPQTNFEAFSYGGAWIVIFYFHACCMVISYFYLFCRTARWIFIEFSFIWGQHRLPGSSWIFCPSPLPFVYTISSLSLSLWCFYFFSKQRIRGCLYQMIFE